MKKTCKNALAVWFLLLMFVSPGAGYGADAVLPPVMSAEEQEIDAAVRKYLDAEMARELRAVYDCLAPSSIYLTTHDYDAYLAEAETSPVRIREYKILRVANIRVNEDRQRFPLAEKFADVEVDLYVHFTDTNQAVAVNFMFIFIKEGGRWYKG